MFNLEAFDGWKNSEEYSKTMALLYSHKASYEKFWGYLLNDRNNYQWSYEDQSKVIAQLDQNMDLNFIHTVVGIKLKEVLNLQNDFSLQQMRPQVLRAILYLNAAQRSEELMGYNQQKPINWQSFYNIIDNSEYNLLQNMVGNIN